MYCHGEQDFELVSGMPLLNWVEYNARTGGFDVAIERDNHTAGNPSGKRVKFRFGIDGPNAGKIFAEAIEGEAPEIKFFGTAKIRIAGCEAMALRHGMAGHQGVELSGRYEDGAAVRAALLDVGRKHGLRQGGTLAYFSTPSESGWMASPFPAIFTSEKLEAYRRWLPASAWEASAQLGGSFVSNRLEDYDVTPWDLAVDRRMNFDHDFVGRAALEKMAEQPKRTRRTLIWNKEDVSRIFNSLQEPGPAFRLLRTPCSSYAYQQYDAVRRPDGALAGLSTFVGYSANEAKFLSLAMMNLEDAEIGAELTLTWGETDGGSRKPQVERHRQTEVRVTVAPASYAEAVRKMKYAAVASATRAGRPPSPGLIRGGPLPLRRRRRRRPRATWSSIDIKDLKAPVFACRKYCARAVPASPRQKVEFQMRFETDVQGAADHGAYTGALKTLLGGYSVELTAADKRSVDLALDILPKGTEVFVAALPNSKVADVVATAARLRRAGLTPVPHIVARNITDQRALRSLLAQFAAEADIDRCLAIGGDRDRPAGEYSSSLQLLQTGLMHQFGIREIFIACYPEGHPKIADECLKDTRSRKLAIAARDGLKVTLLSQFCFDANPIVRFAETIRQESVTAPYRVGVAGPTNRALLLKFALICGVGNSVRLLKGHGDLAAKTLSGETPEALLTEVADAAAANPALGISGIHFFTFGSLAKSVQWAEQYGR